VNDRTRELEGYAKLDLARRMDIAAGCVSGARNVNGSLLEAEKWLEQTKKFYGGRNQIWLFVILAGFLLGGFFFRPALYVLAVVWATFSASAMLNGYLVRVFAQTERDRHIARLVDLKVLWATGGHLETDFDSLQKMIRAEAVLAAEGELTMWEEAELAGDLDGYFESRYFKTYRKWWSEVAQNARRNVHEHLGLDAKDEEQE
jgi:hypothetical protein